MADAASTPLTIRRRRRAPLGILLLAIAGVWLAVPLRSLLLGGAASEPGLGVPGAVCALTIGSALALLALSWIVRCEILVIDQGRVRVTERRPTRTRVWEEPLARYRGVRCRCETLPHRSRSRSWYLVEAWHPEPAKTIELTRSKDPRLIESCAEVWARRLALPLFPDQDRARAESPARGEVEDKAARDRALAVAYPAARSDARSSAA